MDAQLSNQLAHGLSAVATTFGQYALAAHEERMQTAKAQFSQMLEDKRQAAEDNRSANSEAQRAKDHAAETALSRQQHADDKAQQASEFQQTKAQQASQFTETRAQEAERIAIERGAAERAAKAASGDKPASAGERLTAAHNSYIDAKDAYAAAVKEAGSTDVTLGSDAVKAAAKAKIADALQQQVEAKAYMDQIRTAVGMPDSTYKPPTPPTPPTVQYSKGSNSYRVIQGGKTTTMNPDEYRMWQSQNGYGASGPSASVSSPATDTSLQPDSGTGGNSGSSTMPAGPASTAGAYAQNQPPQPLAVPNPNNQTPPIGQPDPNNPVLAA